MFKIILILLGILSPNEKSKATNTQNPASIHNNLFENVSQSLMESDEGGNGNGTGHGNGGNTGGNTGQLPPPF